MKKKSEIQRVLEEMKKSGATAVIIDNQYYVPIDELIKKAKRVFK